MAVCVVRFYVENMDVMIIDAINVSLRLFVLIVVEFGLDFFYEFGLFYCLFA